MYVCVCLGLIPFWEHAIVCCVCVGTLCCEYDVIHTLSQKGKKVIIKVIKIEDRII